MTDHRIGTREEWLVARLELLKAEKELTRRSDELARRRQELPWVRIDLKFHPGEQGSERHSNSSCSLKLKHVNKDYLFKRIVQNGHHMAF